MDKVYCTPEQLSFFKDDHFIASTTKKSACFKGVTFTLCGYHSFDTHGFERVILFLKALGLTLGTLFMGLIIPELRQEILYYFSGKKIQAIYVSEEAMFNPHPKVVQIKQPDKKE